VAAAVRRLRGARRVRLGEPVRRLQGRDQAVLPVTEASIAARKLPDPTVVADARMVSKASQKGAQGRGPSFILGMHIRWVLTLEAGITAEIVDGPR
jgi:hypothetical protein